MNATKKLMILRLFLIIATFMSCKKDESKELTKKLEGRWELSKISGGLDGKTVSYPSGSGNILEFTGSTFRETRNNQITRSGTFKIFKDVSIVTKTAGNRLQLDNTPDTRYFISISKNNLSIDIDVFDPTSLTYQKINE
jgi:hypothetical protein